MHICVEGQAGWQLYGTASGTARPPNLATQDFCGSSKTWLACCCHTAELVRPRLCRENLSALGYKLAIALSVEFVRGSPEVDICECKLRAVVANLQWQWQTSGRVRGVRAQEYSSTRSCICAPCLGIAATGRSFSMLS